MWKRLLKEWFVFSKSERRGIIVLGILLLVVMGIPLVLKFAKPRYTNDYQQLKLKVDSLVPTLPTTSKPPKTAFERHDREAQKFYFDPNVISRDSLLLLGFSPKQATAIINYRQRGGKFRKPEDFLRLSITSNHQHLAGYIRIVQQEKSTVSPQRDSVATKRTYAVTPVDINSADTAELKTLSGVGNYLAQRIVEYRQKLGGYTKLEQLCEIKYFDRDKLERLQPRLTMDLSKVKKFSLTAEGVEQLRMHPYVGAYVARGIAQQIKYNGGATTLDELVQNKILSTEQAEKLRGYIE
ncbi:competence protein ComEA [Bacteroidia bacterium]|nr:competence protein ComEA [Bacteroidia bacterium]